MVASQDNSKKRGPANLDVNHALADNRELSVSSTIGLYATDEPLVPAPELSKEESLQCPT